MTWAHVVDLDRAEAAGDHTSLVLAGGARSTDDLLTARRARAAGVIVGRAVLDGLVDVAEAVACCG